MDCLPAGRPQRIMEGYLEKSPPPSTSTCRLMLSCGRDPSGKLRKRWHKRYFILSSVKKQKRIEIFFQYYKDRECQKFKGRVDLENCRRIISRVPVDGKSNVFSLDTKHNNHNRTYYFAASSDEDMMKWVISLVQVTGFEDDGPDTVSPSLESRLRPIGWPDRLAPLHPSTLQSAIPRLPPALPSTSHAVTSPFGPGLIRSTSVQPWTDSAAGGGIHLPEMDYQLTMPEYEPDDYSKVIDPSYPYVNLCPSDTDGKENHTPTADDVLEEAAVVQSSCPVVPPHSKRHVAPLPDEKVVPSESNNLHSDSPAPTNERRKSTDSVYLTVWDSAEQDVDFTEPSASRRECTGLQTPPPLVRRQPVVTPKLSTTTADPEPHHEEELASVYQELPPDDAPMELAPLPMAPPPPPPIPLKPPRLAGFPLASGQRLVAPGRMAALSPGEILGSPLRSNSLDACNDLVLPVRAAGSGAAEDTSSTSGSSSADEDSDPSLSPASPSNNGGRDGHHQTLEHAKAVPTPPSTSNCVPAAIAPVPRPVFPSPPTEHLPGPLPFSPILPPQPLNYIEPCNLELGLPNGAGPVSRPPHLVNSSKTNTASGSAVTQLVVSRPPRAHPDDTVHMFKSSDQFPVATSHSQGRSQAMNQSDERIEYREIDHLSTRALEDVSKHF